jgi:hypothetical protein
VRVKICTHRRVLAPREYTEWSIDDLMCVEYDDLTYGFLVQKEEYILANTTRLGIQEGSVLEWGIYLECDS